MPEPRLLRSCRCLALASLALLLASCDTPAGRFFAWVWSPDKVATTGEHTLALEGAPAPVTVWLDAHAVPHIDAPDERSLAYAIGYMHGRDRRFQLECFKLAAHGRLREMVGGKDPTGVLKNLEVYGRMLGFTALGKRFLAAAPPDDQAQLVAYAAGVNDATAHEPRPMELRLLDYRPDPWAPEDTAAIVAMISFGLCKNWSLELARLELIVHQLRTGGSLARALAIFPARYRLPPHLIEADGSADPFAAIPPVAPELIEHLRGFVAEVGPAKLERSAATSLGGDGAMDAHYKEGGRSNNWAVGGQWTGTGKGALSSDPHMVHSMPAFGYLLHVRAASTPVGPVEAIGAGFPGLPTVTFGTNGHVAWGVTANWADVADVYVERSRGEGHYEVDGRSEPFAVRQEEFKIRRDDGGFDVERLTVRETRHGVVLNDFIDHVPERFPICALRWSEGHQAIAAFRGLYSARTVRDARGALERFDAMVGHWVLADEQGSVGYAGTAPLPLRTRHLGTLPVPGWTGTYEWQGTLDPARLPWVENPAMGFVATANNQIVHPDATGFPLNFDGDVNHRYLRILEVLGKGRQGRRPVEVIAALEQDGVDMGHGQVLAVTRELVTPLVQDRDPLVAAAAKAYLAWDGNAAPDSIGATIYQSLCALLVQQMLADEVDAPALHFVLTYFNIEPFFYGLLTDAANPAWDDRLTEAVETPADVVAPVFRAAVARLAARYGKDPVQWTWSRAAPFVLEHAFGRIGMLAPLLNRGPLPTRGTGNTVFKHQFMRDQLVHFPVKYGPVLRVNIDLADLAGSRMSVPGGQSGRPASPHYADLLPLYAQGQGVSMRMGFDGIAARCPGKLLLRPKG